MTDKEKLDKLVAEIERRLLPTVRDKHYDEWEEGGNNALINILSFYNSMQEEPVSEDLESEIHRFLHEIHDRDTTVSDVAHHFANWQKRQMKKNALDGWLRCDDSRDMNVFFISDYFRSADAEVIDYKLYEKVKMIIIKED